MKLSNILTILSIASVMAIAIHSKLVTAQTLPYLSSELEEFLPEFKQLVQQSLENLESREKSPESLIVEIKSVKSTNNKKTILIEAEIKRVIHSQSGLKPRQSIYIQYEKPLRGLIDYPPVDSGVLVHHTPYELGTYTPPDVYVGEIIQVFLKQIFLKRKDSLSSISIYIPSAGRSSFEWNIPD